MRRLGGNLLFRFSAVSFVVMLSIALSTVIALSYRIRSDAIEDVVQQAVGASQGRLLSAITPEDLGAPMTGERYDRFHEFVQQSIVSDLTARVNLWSKDGALIYSSNYPEARGADAEVSSDNENVRKSLLGENVAEIHEPEEVEGIYESRWGPSRLMEVYTPIVFPGMTEPQGVFEIYQYYKPTAQRIDSMRKTVFVSIGMGFVVLYTVLVIIVWRGSRIIGRQQAALASANEALKNAHAGLEARVQQRTADLSRANATLRASEERFRTLIESSQEGIVAYDTDIRYTLWNPAMESISGVPSGEVLGRSPFEVFPFLEEVGAADAFREAVKGKATVRPPMPYDVPDTGARGYFETSHFPLFDAHGDIIGGMGIVRDVTERKRAEEMLRGSEERFRSVAESAVEAIIVADADGNIDAWNRGAQIMFGYAAEEVLGRPTTCLMPERYVDAYLRGVRRLRAAGGPRLKARTLQLHGLRKDGSEFPCELSFASWRHGEQSFTSAIIRDITERREAEEQLRRSEETQRRLAEEQTVLAEIGRIINSSLDIDQVYERFAEEVRKLIPSDRLTVNIIDAERGTFTTAHVSGVEVPHLLHGNRTPLAGTFVEALITGRTRVLFQTDDEEEVASHFPGLLPGFRQGFRSFLGVPLISSGQVIGTLQWHSTKPNCYTQRNLALAEQVADQIAHAIANAQLYAERREAEEALQESERRYRLLAENVADVIWVRGLDMRLIYISPSVERLRGYSVEEVLAQSFERVVVPASFEVFMKALEEELALERLDGSDPSRSRTLELEMNCKDGSTLWTETRMSFLRDAGGRPTAVLGVTRDITERRRAEEELRLNTAALTAAANGILITDAEGTIRWVNPAFTDLTGYTAQEAIGRNPRILKSGEHAPAFYENLWKTITSGKVWRGEIVNRRKDGSLYAEEMTITSVRGPLGEITNFVAIKQDISERKRLEEQFLQSQKMESVGRLAGGVAHDFNNLLTGILGYCQLGAMKHSPGCSAHPYFGEIQDTAQRAANLTHQLLAFSRRQFIEPRVVNLNETIAALDKMLRRLIGEDVELVTVSAPDLGRVLIDPGQIDQVLMNLAVNARDAMPGGGRLTIETEGVTLDESFVARHPDLLPGEYVMLTVSDTGFGMTDEVKAHAFEPFFTTKEVGEGTGLGLSTCYGIVKQNRGHIAIDSEPHVGTTVRIYLPGVDEATAERPRRQDATLSPRGTETILLVEDERSVRDLTAEMLRLRGYNVLCAADGVEALETIQGASDEEIDLLLADVIMPHMGGKELADQLLELRPDLKVLYMSGYAGDAIARQGVLGHGIDLIQKPFTPSSLARRIRAVLDRQ